MPLNKETKPKSFMLVLLVVLKDSKNIYRKIYLTINPSFYIEMMNFGNNPLSILLSFIYLFPFEVKNFKLYTISDVFLLKTVSDQKPNIVWESHYSLRKLPSQLWL